MAHTYRSLSGKWLEKSKKERENAEKDRANGKSTKIEASSLGTQDFSTASYDHSIDWSDWDYADVIVGNGPSSGSSNSVPYGYYRHAATYDGRSEDFINAMPDEGVYRETQNFWETEYREVAGFFASSANTTERVVAVQYLRDQIGEPYLWDSSKTTYSKWYCSKLPYVAYEKKADLNIDTDGGYWVFPDDIAEDNDMDLFMSSEN